jgi:signal transduction histidine kinase
MDNPGLHLDILNRLQTGVVVHGPDTRVLFSNPRASALLGLSVEQMLGKAAMDDAWHFVDEAGNAMPVAEYPVNRVIASGQAIKDLVLGVNASAHPQTVWLLVSAFPQLTAQGQLHQVVVDFYDITSLKHAQAEQKANEVFTAAVLDSLTEQIAVLDSNAHITAVNLAWRAFGQSNGAPDRWLNPIGTNYLSVCQSGGAHPHAEAAEGADACTGIQAVLSGRLASFQLEYPCHSPTEKRWFRMNVTPLAGRNGGAVVSHLNITEQRKSELQALSNMQLLLGSIEAIDEAFVIYDADERLVFCNEKYRELYPEFNEVIALGAKFEDIIRAGAQMRYYLAATEDPEAWVQERLAAFRAGNQTRIQRTRSGRVVRAIERKMADGHTVGFRIDITDLVTATDAALAASNAKSRFLATMSHEIRTPLNGILGMAQLLQMPDLPGGVRQDYAQTILSSGQTLLTLLNDILDLSKIEAGKFQLENTAFAPAELLRQTTNLFAGAAQAKGLQLQCQWHGAEDQRFVADADRLRQMLSNLVGNAIKFTRAGQVRVNARELPAGASSGGLEFSVSDSGVGIPADKLDLLFKPFSQADNSITREFGGSGLGLSIVQQLAKAMGGEVGVHSKPGQGSTFWFRVAASPAAEVTDNTTAQPAAHADETAHALNQGFTGHVLVVEDNLVNCLVAKSLLEQLGLTVSQVHDGQQAVNALTQAPPQASTNGPLQPNLILMDLQMPVMDGYSATEHIRRWEACQHRPRVPIIAVTADAFEEDRQHCLTVGMDDFLTKPIALEALKTALAR